MSEHKYTPAPWRVVENERSYNIRSEKDDKPICEMWLIGETDANARLIAAAPELLKACEVARGAIVFGNGKIIDWDGIADILTAAIAKTTEEDG